MCRTKGSWRSYISKVAIEYFDVAMDYFEGDEFVVAVADSADEEERSVSPVDNFGICLATLSILEETG